MRLPLPYTPQESGTLSPPTSGGSCSSSTRPPRPPGSWPCTWRDRWRSPTRSTSCRSPCTACDRSAHTAVSWYFGSRNCRDFAMAPGRQSKLIFTIFVISSGVKLPCSVPYVSTKSESGFATPIAYESCTSARLQRPLFTTDLAICRQMYAAERSTFVGSFPENAPPPCAPHPPYVSMMILRPVSPASPWGPPMMNLPDGLMWRWVCSPYSVSAGLPFFSLISDRVFFTTCSTINLFISSIDGAVISLPL